MSRRVRTGARLQVCGSDPLAVRLLLTRLRVADAGIDILGFLPKSQLTALLSRTKLLVAPSLGGESFGMVLTNAFACALPVVASDIPGYREVLTPESSVSVSPDDPAQLVEAITSLLADEPRREAMGEVARRLAVENYAWSDVARRLEEIYERAIERGRKTVAV